jgi:hypothetical protein
VSIAAKPPASVLAEIAAAIVLSVAALLTSWAGFQAALWDGEQAAHYAEAGAARVRAGLLATERGQGQAVDLVLFTQWLDAYAQRETQLELYYRARFRPEFARAFEAWLERKPSDDPHAPPSPFAMAEYRPRHAAEAAAMERRADALFAEGQHDNEVSDRFVQSTVVLALALFLGGIGQTFERTGVRLALSGLAALACIFGLAQLFSLPVLSL